MYLPHTYGNSTSTLELTSVPIIDEPTPYDRMLLIAYSVRPGSEERGYESWLRDVDNPFFNAAPGFAHYSNWKVAGGTNLFAPHLYFDFVGMRGADDFDAVWNGAEVNEFRREWRRLWGVDTQDASMQIQTCLCIRSSPSATAPGRFLTLASGRETGPGWQMWDTSDLLRGRAFGFDAFSVRNHDGAGAAADRPGALQAECIAAPGLRPL